MRMFVAALATLGLVAGCTSRSDYNAARAVGDRFNSAYESNDVDAAIALGTPALRAGMSNAALAALIQRARTRLGACGSARPLGANFARSPTTYVITLSYERTCSGGPLYENLQVDMKARPHALAGIQFASTNPRLWQDSP